MSSLRHVPCALAALLLTSLVGPACGDDATGEPAPEPLPVTFTSAPFTTGSAEARFATDVSCGPDALNAFDIALPTVADGPTPLVIYIHGGGFTGGDKADYWPADGEGSAEITAFLEAGVAVASMNYRLLDDVDTEGVIKPLMDSARCLQFIRYHAASTFGVDRDRIALMGGSAGAGTSLWLAFHDDMADPDAEDPIARMSTRAQVVAVSETQSTYDVVRWSDDVFAEYGLGDILSIVAGTPLEARLTSFYGIDSVADIDRADIVAYRADVDMLALMDAGDPGFWVTNNREPVEIPLSTGLLFHHAYHARELEERAAEVGVTADVTWGEDAEPGVTRHAYVLRALAELE